MPDKSERPLRLLDLTALGVNAIVGSSIFLFPGRLAALLGPASIAAFGLTGLLLLAVGLCFAEAAGRFDRPGGPYVYASEAFGARAGFAIGWLCWGAMIFSWAAVADGIALYLGWFGPAFAAPWVVKGTAAAVILAATAVNYRGVKLGAWTSNLFTAAKLVPLGLFVLAGLPRLARGFEGPFAPHGWKPLGAACFMAYFAFQGFETVPVPAGEARAPERDVPRAVMGSLAFAAVFYMLVQAAAVASHPGLAGSERPLADAAAVLLGPWGAALMVAGAAVSMTGFCAGSALGGPRYLVALAQDGHLPEVFARPHPRYGTPAAAVALSGGLALAAALALDFRRLVDFTNVVVCAQYAATCAAVPLLRRRLGASLSFRLPGGLLVPAAGLGATFWLGAQGELAQVAGTLVLLALGFALRAGHRSTLRRDGA